MSEKRRMSPLSKYILPVAGVLFLALLAIFLRLYNLTILPVFADEAIYIRWSQIMAAEPTLRFLPLSDGKQPLYMWVLMVIVNRFSDPLMAGRLISAMSGSGTLIGIVALSYVLFNSRKAALASGLLWAVSPIAVFFDRMALVDSMLAMWTTWTIVFAVITAKTKRTDTAMITGLLLGMTALTKSPALFIAMLMPATLLVSNFPKKIPRKAIHVLKLFGLLLITYFLAIVMYNALRLGPNFHLLSERTLDYVFPLSHLWNNPLDPLTFNLNRAFNWIFIMGPAPIYLLSLLGIAASVGKRREVILLTAFFLIPLFIQSEFAKSFTARYIIYILPPLFVLAGTAMLHTKRLLVASAITLFVFIAMAVDFNAKLLTNPEAANLPRTERSGYLEEWTAGTGIKEVADIIKNIHADDPEQKLVVGTEGFFGTLPDGLQMYLQGIQNLDVVGIGLGINKTPINMAVAKTSGDRVFIAANSSRLNPGSRTFEDLGWEVVAAIPKAQRPDGYKEYVNHGPHDTFYLFEVKRIEWYLYEDGGQE